MSPPLDLSLRRAPWLCLALLLGCSEIVVLGSECPEAPGSCPELNGGRPDAAAGRDAEVERDAEPGLDAQVEPDAAVDAAALDAMVTDASVPDGGRDAAVDAAVDAGPQLALFPMLQNGSFEITRGGTGDIAWQPPGAPAILGAQVEPWTACRSGLQAQAYYAPIGGVPASPVDGQHFIVDQLALGNPVGLNQVLSQPVRRGVTYAFSVALRVSRAGESASLNVFGTSVPCLPTGGPLATTRPITETTWQRICLRFTPVVDHAALMLAGSTEILSSSALLMDDLRYDADCAQP